MTNKQLKELQKVNAVVNSINRVLDYGLQILKQETTNDLAELRHKLRQKAQELVKS